MRWSPGCWSGVYAGLVLLATEVLRFSSPVAVAASTLAAAALFTPVRRRVQRVVDRRFNRARYDADRTRGGVRARLKDAVDLDAVRADLARRRARGRWNPPTSRYGSGTAGDDRAAPLRSGRGPRLASPATAVVLGGVVLALMVADGPARPSWRHLGLSSGGGGGWYLGPVFGVVGFVVAWRKPGNPLGWLLLGAVGFLVLSGDAGAYAVADYRLRHGGLPLGWVAVLLQPGWAPAIALFGLSVLLFPDGRLPSRRWRWALWALPGRGRAVDRGHGHHLGRGHHRPSHPGGLRREPAGPRPSRRSVGVVGLGPERVLPAARRVLAGVRGRPGASATGVPRASGGSS